MLFFGLVSKNNYICKINYLNNSMHSKSVIKTNNYLLIAFPMLNLLFMHYYFYFNGILEWAWKYSVIINIYGVTFDVLFLLVLFLTLFRGRFKPAIAIVQALTLIWSFVNVMYGKFFFQYMSLSAIGEAHGLGNGLVSNSILSAFYWYDLFYLISGICFIIVYKNTQSVKYSSKIILKLLVIPVLSVLLTIVTFTAYHKYYYRYGWESYKLHSLELLYDLYRGGTPNLAHFQTGCVRVFFCELFDKYYVLELTPEQKKQIEVFYLDHSQRVTNHKRNPQIRNVIFILLESFLSAPIDLKVDGKEITPFLNSLKRDSDVYYNGNMISDIGCGESADGQFIYMTGIMPLKYKMTVGQVKDKTFPSLPKALRNELSINNTEIVIPTSPNFWQQTDMNVVYGIDHSYSLVDITGDNWKEIDDEVVFDFAAQSLSESKPPFFSLILSVSAHHPYDRFFGENLFLKDKSLSEEYKNYLNTCHYTDKQVMNYFQRLKSKGLYENSLIVIASDHYAHLGMLKMTGSVSDYTPLFIIHGNVDDTNVWKGEFHQLDVFTTLLDLLDIKQEWRGLGHTLLSSKYSVSTNKDTYNISKMIIEGDYFEK